MRPNSESIVVENYGVDGPFMNESEFRSGSLVLLGHNLGYLEENKVREFVALASRMNSLHTLRSTEGIMNRVTALTFCYKCSLPSKE